jgi:hypothetical protein
MARHEPLPALLDNIFTAHQVITGDPRWEVTRDTVHATFAWPRSSVAAADCPVNSTAAGLQVVKVGQTPHTGESDNPGFPSSDNPTTTANVPSEGCSTKTWALGPTTNGTSTLATNPYLHNLGAVVFQAEDIGRTWRIWVGREHLIWLGVPAIRGLGVE